MHKILFLDIDGVLNYQSTLKPDIGYNSSYRAWCPLCVFQLKRIIEQTNCKIVISSTWRLDKEGMAEIVIGFIHYGINPNIIIGETDRLEGISPILEENSRLSEIEKWVKDHDIKDYAIVDDNSVAYNYLVGKDLGKSDRFVKTDFFAGGLLNHHADMIIDILGWENRGTT